MSNEDLQQKLTEEIEQTNDDDDVMDKEDVMDEPSDIFALTEKVEASKEEIEELINQIQSVIELLILAASSINRDVNNLPVQVHNS